MTNDRDDQTSEHADRLREVERLTGSVVALRAEPVPIRAARLPVVPVPRRSRVFLRHGEGHGAFAEITLTAPLRRSVMT